MKAIPKRGPRARQNNRPRQTPQVHLYTVSHSHIMTFPCIVHNIYTVVQEQAGFWPEYKGVSEFGYRHMRLNTDAQLTTDIAVFR